MNVGALAIRTVFAVALTSGLLYLATGTGMRRARVWADWAFRAQAVLLLLIVFWLWHLLVTHQFQYAYVASYTSRDLEPRYLFAALWGGQQGTFLLWATWGALLGVILARSKNRLVPTAMFFLNWAQIFLLLILVIEGPFKMIHPVPADGQGLNPLLQDYWMTIHPPVLFLGYSSLIVPYALALSTLCHRDKTAWLSITPRWSLFSTVILATGFTMGGIWAYKVLGWGGFWGWDPVENASLVPWLMNAALFHGLLVQRATGSLARTNLFLGILPFLFVLYGSFLTRSGILADFSVHSFVDLGLNGYLLSFLGFIAVLGAGTWLVRSGPMAEQGKPIGSVSREFGLWLGMLTFLLMGILTMLGTSAPLVSRLFGAPSAVQSSYYGVVNGILGVLLSALTGLAPLVRWRHDRAERVMRSAVTPAALAFLGLTVGVLLGVRQPMALILLGTAGFAFAANLVITARALRRGPAFAAGYVSHLGVAIFLVGVLGLSQFGRELPVELPLGQPKSAFGFEFTYRGLEAAPHGRSRAVIAVRGEGREFRARPPLYYSEFNRGMMRAPHVERFWDRDLYISPVEILQADRGLPGITLSRGESGHVGDALVTFQSVSMERTEGQVRVTADVLVERDGKTEQVRPALVVDLGESKRTSVPAPLAGGGSVDLTDVQADLQAGQRRITLAVRTPGMPAAPEALAVQISTKPLINLVWIGVCLTLVGSLLAIRRRSKGPGSVVSNPA
jgi:cytochrome c-type biogenesis protein CcmF